MSEYLKDDEKITVPVTGEPVSIWSGELKNIIYAIDDKIVRALRTALENRTGFEVNAKSHSRRRSTTVRLCLP